MMDENVCRFLNKPFSLEKYFFRFSQIRIFQFLEKLMGTEIRNFIVDSVDKPYSKLRTIRLGGTTNDEKNTNITLGAIHKPRIHYGGMGGRGGLSQWFQKKESS